MKRPDYIEDERTVPEELRNYIVSLEAPYKLVDKPPSEPGRYWTRWPAAGLKIIEVTPEHIEKGAINLKSVGVKWGSAPLPMPMESYDE